jgi:hypothetical protein
MTTKEKTFDCVEMKRQCQEKMRLEYESRKDEFTSYLDFINHKAEESNLWKILQDKIARAKAKSAS